MTTRENNITYLLPKENETCFVVSSFLSASQCKEILSTEVLSSFNKANLDYPSYYRNNDRLVIEDELLAIRLLRSAKNYLPKAINTETSIESEKEIWKLKGINEKFRFCKYSKNQYFHRHIDGIYYRNEREQSKLTFLIYLNGAKDFKGGRTMFYKTKETDEVWCSYTPKQGDLIVFDHNIWHEGEQIHEGEKYVLRSDVLYSKKKVSRERKPFVGHLGYIWAILKLDITLLSGGRDKKIKVWDFSGKELQCLEGHENSVLCIEKVNKNIFITGSRDRQIIVWKDYKIRNIIKIHNAVILSLCYLEEDIFVSSSGDNTIKICTLDGTTIRTYSEHNDWAWEVIKLTNNYLASCSADGTIKIWNTRLKESINTFKERKSIISLTYHRSRRTLISGNIDGEISMRILNKSFKEEKIKTFKAHSGLIRTIKVINKNLFATGGEDNKMKIWSLSGDLIFEGKHENFVQSLEVLERKYLLSASYDGTIKKWKIE